MQYGIAGATVELADISGLTAALANLVLRATEGGVSATLAGSFVDIFGNVVSPDGGTTYSYTGTIDTTPRTLVGASAGVRILGLTAIPAGAVGFVGRLSADIIVCAGAVGGLIPANLTTDINASPARYKKRFQSDAFTLGRGE